MLKNQYNKEANREGYWESHYKNGRLSSKGYYINNIRVGYWEDYSLDGLLNFKIYFVV